MKASRWWSGNVLALGLVSLFTDAASEMILPLLPIFLASIGGGAFALGLVEGMADATANIVKLWSGKMADRQGKYKPLILGGYALSSVTRPFFALAALPAHVLAIRIVDRIGKGLRSSPRDAILAASVPIERRGRAFGFHRGMDHAGAVIGPAIAWVLLTQVTEDLRVIFALSAIPGALAVLTILLGVGEPARPPASTPVASDVAQASGATLGGVLVPLTLFSAAQASDLFLLLRAGEGRTSPAVLPLLWIALHIVKSLSSVPGGQLADRIGAPFAIASGWALFAGVFFALAFAESHEVIVALVLLSGVHYGLQEAGERSLIASLVPAAQRGTAFGKYYLATGLAALVANAVFGGLWEASAPRVAFLYAAGMAIVALIAGASWLALRYSGKVRG